jgi:hypothetical protein
MTLHTRFLITDKGADPQEVFEVNRLIVGCPDSKYTVEDKSISNSPNQGFDAWLWVDHGDPIAHDCWCDEYRSEGDTESLCSGCTKPTGYVEVNWDTAYGYRSERGGCGDLHAHYITLMAEWCQRRELGWTWYNEFAGTWHTSLDDLAGFGKAWGNAREWFDTVAAPAIAMQIASHGREN